MLKPKNEGESAPRQPRYLCHHCGAMRKRVFSIPMPKGQMPSGRTAIRVCYCCIETLDIMATDAERNPNPKPRDT